MILPTKHLRPDRSLIALGADVLSILREPKTVSRLWEEFRDLHHEKARAPVTYEWFILTIDLLYLMGAVRYQKGQVQSINQRLFQ
jgi:hypothetical protein